MKAKDEVGNPSEGKEDKKQGNRAGRTPGPQKLGRKMAERTLGPRFLDKDGVR